jgi:hypothetical protein
MKTRTAFWSTIILVACSTGLAKAQAPVGTTFTYQGQLKQAGLPVTNTADFQFTLWDALAGGNQIGAMISVNGKSVVNGLFTVTPDFGAGVFPGDARWLQIAVRSPAGSGSFTTLSPRQELTPTAYALYGVDADKVDGYHAGNSSGQVAVSNGTKCTNLHADKVDGYDAGNNAGQVAVSNGTACTNLNADYVDGYHAGNSSGQVALSNGTVCGTLNADKHDGYDAGNSAGQVAVSNGTVCSTLNADKTDGNHVAATNVYTASGTQYVVNTGYCKIYAFGTSNTLRLENPSGNGYTMRYYYSVNFAAPTYGNLTAGSTVDIGSLDSTTIDIRIYSGGGWVTFFGCSGGNGWLRGHVIYTD